MANRLEIVISAADRASGPLNKVGKELAAQKEHLRGLNVLAAEYTAAGRKQMMVAAGIGAALGGAVREAATFEEGMWNVNSLVRANEETFRGMHAAVLDMTRDPMVNDAPQVLARGLYDIVSAGLQGQNALDTLSVASKGAAAGLSTTATAADVLTSVMNAYNQKTGPEAQRIMDVLFMTVERGKLTFDQLAASFSMASTTAASAGVSVEEVAAGMATMTKQGHDAAVSATALNRVITTFLNPNERLLAQIKAYGYESGMQILQTRGIAGAMEWLTEVTGGNADQMVSLLGEMRAVRASLALTGNGAQMFADDLEAMRNSSGAMSAALQEQAKGALFQWKSMVGNLNVAAIELGDVLLPMLKSVSEGVRAGAEWFGKLPKPVKQVIAVTALATAAGFGFIGMINLGRGAVLAYTANLLAMRAAKAAVVTEGGNVIGMLGRLGTAKAAAGRAWTWLAGLTKLSWAGQWAATKTHGTQMLGLLGSAKAGLIGAVGGLKAGLVKLPGIIKAVGIALKGFLLSPVGAVVVALAIMIASLARTYGMYKEMRAAQKEAEAAEKRLKGFEEEHEVVRDKTGAVVSIGKPVKARATAASPPAPLPAGEGRRATAGAGGPLMPGDVLAAAREREGMQATRREGAEGAEQYLRWLRQQKEDEGRQLREMATAEGSKEAWEEFHKWQVRAAEELAAAEQDVLQARKQNVEQQQREQERVRGMEEGLTLKELRAAGLSEEARELELERARRRVAEARGELGPGVGYGEAGELGAVAAPGGRAIMERRVTEMGDGRRMFTFHINVGTRQEAQRVVNRALAEAFAY